MAQTTLLANPSDVRKPCLDDANLDEKACVVGQSINQSIDPGLLAVVATGTLTPAMHACMRPARRPNQTRVPGDVGVVARGRRKFRRSNAPRRAQKKLRRGAPIRLRSICFPANASKNKARVDACDRRLWRLEPDDRRRRSAIGEQPSCVVRCPTPDGRLFFPPAASLPLVRYAKCATLFFFRCMTPDEERMRGGVFLAGMSGKGV